MDNLPDEILLNIFSYLTSKDLILRCGAVCKRWQRLVKDESLWQEIDLSSCKVNLRALVKVFKYERIRSVNLKNARILDPKSWTNLFSPNKLETLNLSNALISPRGLGHILKSTSMLTYINLSGCHLNHIVCKAIASNANLKSLDLSFCKKVSPCLYEMLFKKCQLLEELNVSHFCHLYRYINHIEGSALRKLCVSYTHLEFWDLKPLISQCPKLAHLDISYNYVGPNGAAKLKEDFPNLLEIINHNHRDFIESESDYEGDAESWESCSDESEQSEFV